jgi:hypothetical protein
MTSGCDGGTKTKTAPDPYMDCVSDDECVEVDGRYDSCQVVCAGDLTLCRVSCETSDDCKGIGLPDSWAYCNVARPGEGFCYDYDYDYQPGDCVP